ncbi:MAG: leucine-rich repeat protein [Rikenellaceae bacterium]|nr:leucine-rich repeat protein [Rikenellaceae bacterium]
MKLDVTAVGFSGDTRASESGYVTSFTNDDEIGVTVIENGTTIIEDNVPYKKTSGGWVPTTNRTAHAYSGNITYLVHYPYSATHDGKTTEAAIAAGFTPQSDQSTYAAYTASDLMTGSGSENGGTLTVTLTHAMSLVEIELPAGATGGELKIGGTVVSTHVVSGALRRIVEPSATPVNLSGSYTFAGFNIVWAKNNAIFEAGKYAKVSVTNPSLDAVLSVDVTSANLNAIMGTTKTFNASVAIMGAAANTVTWSVSPTGGGSTIDASGLLTISATETSSQLTVTATSTYNTAISGSATVEVYHNPNEIAAIFAAAAGSGTTTADPKQIVIPRMLWGADVKAAIDAQLNTSTFYSLDLSAIEGVTQWESGATMIGAPYVSNDADYGKFTSTRSRIVALVLPNSVTSIAGGALRGEGQYGGGWGNLASVTGVNVTSLGNDVLSNERIPGTLKVANFPKLQTTGGYVFHSAGLTSINYPELTTIGNGLFYKCTSLTTLSLPALTTSGGNLVSLCTSLTTLDLPELITIGIQMANGCTALATVNIPKVTTIGYEAFKDGGNAVPFTIKLGSTQHTFSGGNCDNWFRYIDGKAITFLVPTANIPDYNTWVAARNVDGSTGPNYFGGTNLAITVTGY